MGQAGLLVCSMTGQHVIFATLMHAMLLMQPAVVQLAAVIAFVVIPSMQVTHVHAAHSCAHISDHTDLILDSDHGREAHQQQTV